MTLSRETILRPHIPIIVVYVHISVKQLYLAGSVLLYHSTHALILSTVWAPSKKYLTRPQAESKMWFLPGQRQANNPVAVSCEIENGGASSKVALVIETEGAVKETTM